MQIPPATHSEGASDGTQGERRAAMALLAQADTASIERGLAAVERDAQFADLRPPEIGLVMLRGRIGGTGSAFNVGEATVTRAAVQLSTGEIGFSYVLGRDVNKARLAAICDALWQTGSRDDIERHVLGPLRQAREARLDHERARTAATKVDFFTLVRGEDAR
jgi:alpha-D-ribose 1-methylphosphonate 5-triphosphate synthase subunit PhnG